MLNEPLPNDLIAKIAKTRVAIDGIHYKPLITSAKKSSVEEKMRSAK